MGKGVSVKGGWEVGREGGKRSECGGRVEVVITE